jgi:hypothetical protein
MLEREHLQQPDAVAGMPVHRLADQKRCDCVGLDEQDLEGGCSRGNAGLRHEFRRKRKAAPTERNRRLPAVHE